MAIGVEAAGQNDDECLGLGVDPEAGPGKAGMAEAGAAEQGPARRTKTGLYVPAQPSPLALRSRRGVDHRPHRQWRKHSPTVGPDAPVQEGLGEDRQIVGRCEETGVAGHPGKCSRSRVVDHAPEHGTAWCLAFGGSDPGDRNGGWNRCSQAAEMGLAHPERFKDTLPARTPPDRFRSCVQPACPEPGTPRRSS